MTGFANRIDSSAAVAGVSPVAAASTVPMSTREEKRLIRLQIWVWGKQFAARLKDNARRMKQFLHAGR